MAPTPKILLISMPFGPLAEPSIALGLLKAGLQREALDVSCLYFNLKFAAGMSPETYTRICNGEPATYDLAGEWIFSKAIFPNSPHSEDSYIRNVLQQAGEPAAKSNYQPKEVSSDLIDSFISIRGRIEDFLNECLDEIREINPAIVGFTSVFQQQMASLALATRIKSALPATTIVFGGANCEGRMGREIVDQFEFVDAVVSGEGDVVFPQLVSRILAGKQFSDIRGVYTKNNSSAYDLEKPENAESITQMDELPIPEYDDFFSQWKSYGLDKSELPPPRLSFETARGCWWGAKHHCTFCGLNGSNMAFRSKSPERALNELLFLLKKYECSRVSVVDNILDMKYFNNFIPSLAEQDLDLDMFYEVKANLAKNHVRLLKKAGINSIQPGIENFSDEVLKLMRKGVSGLQNIQLLKWCKELGVEAHWNFLWGFPGERPEEYERIAKFFPYLFHLRPPSSISPLRLDRFSPNFDYADALGFKNIQPYPSYSYIYDLDEKALFNLAYFFTYDMEMNDTVKHTDTIARLSEEWKSKYADNDLFYAESDDKLLIWDLRECAVQPLFVLQEPLKSCYTKCDSIQSLTSLQRIIEARLEEGITLPETRTLLAPLLKNGLMMGENDSFLSLAIPLGEYSPTKEVLEKFYGILKEIGHEGGKQDIAISLNDFGME